MFDSQKLPEVKVGNLCVRFNTLAIVCIEGMNHTLGAKHPWNEENLPMHLDKVIQLSIDFIKS